MAKARQSAAVDTGRAFYGGASGRWAGEKLMRAMLDGRPISPKELRTLDLLRKNEWEHLDLALVEEGHIRLRGVADLMAAGLTIAVPNAMGKTIVQWETVTDMEPAITSLSGVDRSEDDRVEFELLSVPLPITHKDFNLNLRHLSASRTTGESLDTTQARVAGRLVAERLEEMLFQGGPTFGSAPIYGYTTHPDRNQGTFGAGGFAAYWSGAGVTGEQILADILRMIQTLEGDRMYGPYWLYIPADISTKFDNDFKANSDKTIRQRLLEVDRLSMITLADQLPNNNVVMCQATRDVVALVEGEPLQSVQWDIEGGFIIKFKAFQIAVPLIRSDHAGRSGVFHLHT
jgi:uncharacterized linocin/CFP29 family protein